MTPSGDQRADSRPLFLAQPLLLARARAQVPLGLIPKVRHAPIKPPTTDIPARFRPVLLCSPAVPLTMTAMEPNGQWADNSERTSCRTRPWSPLDIRRGPRLR